MLKFFFDNKVEVFWGFVYGLFWYFGSQIVCLYFRIVYVLIEDGILEILLCFDVFNVMLYDWFFSLDVLYFLRLYIVW